MTQTQSSSPRDDPIAGQRYQTRTARTHYRSSHLGRAHEAHVSLIGRVGLQCQLWYICAP